MPETPEDETGGNEEKMELTEQDRRALVEDKLTTLREYLLRFGTQLQEMQATWNQIIESDNESEASRALVELCLSAMVFRIGAATYCDALAEITSGAEDFIIQVKFNQLMAESQEMMTRVTEAERIIEQAAEAAAGEKNKGNGTDGADN